MDYLVMVYRLCGYSIHLRGGEKMSATEKQVEQILKEIIELSSKNNHQGFEFTPYELMTLQSAYLLLKTLLNE